MYAERARLGAFGSFLVLRAGFSAFSAAFRWREMLESDVRQSEHARVMKSEKKKEKNGFFFFSIPPFSRISWFGGLDDVSNDEENIYLWFS